MEALGETRDQRATDGLLRALGDADLNVRNAAVEALGRVGGPQALTALLGAFANADTRFAAFPALRELAPSLILEDLSLDQLIAWP